MTNEMQAIIACIAKIAICDEVLSVIGPDLPEVARGSAEERTDEIARLKKLVSELT